MSSCLIRSNSSGTKELHRKVGKFKDPSQVREEQKKQRNEAATAVKRLCGSVLKKRTWVESDSTLQTEGFFFAAAKPKSCPQQHVSIGVKAAKFMQAKSITCSQTPDNYLRFEIPQSPSYTERIKVRCNIVSI